MQYLFDNNERAAVMKRHQETMRLIGTIIELKGFHGSVELLPDLSGFTIKEEECQSIQK